MYLLFSLLFSSLVVCSIYLFIAVIFIAVLAPIRLEFFQSIYYVLLSKYFSNRIYLKTFKYILPPVSKFSFNFLKDLFQGIELTPVEAVLCALQIRMDYQCVLCIGRVAFFLQIFSFIVKLHLSFNLVNLSFKGRRIGHFWIIKLKA